MQLALDARLRLSYRGERPGGVLVGQSRAHRTVWRRRSIKTTRYERDCFDRRGFARSQEGASARFTVPLQAEPRRLQACWTNTGRSARIPARRDKAARSSATVQRSSPLSPVISSSNRNLARFQSRVTASAESFSTSAVRAASFHGGKFMRRRMS